jgi:predicted nucleotidyltransferase
MDHQTEWRLDAAHTLAEKLKGKTGIRAVMVGGSAARGYSDVYSDLELIAYWDRQPHKEEKRIIAGELGAVHRYPKIDHGHESALEIKGFPVDLWHKAVSEEEGILDRVLDEFSTDLGANNIVDTVRTGLPLYGEELIRKWQERTEQYPDELTRRFLDEYLPHFHLRQLHFAARRNNPAAFFNIISNIQSSLFIVLLALNGSYFPTYKWMFKRLHELPVKPENLEWRLREMYRESPIEAAARLREVLEETVQLVEAQYPDLDIEFARYGVDQPVPERFSDSPFGRNQ